MSRTFIIADNQAVTAAGLQLLITQQVKAPDIVRVADKEQLVKQLMRNSMASVWVDYTQFDFNGFEEFKVLQHRFDNAIWIMFASELSEAFIRLSSAMPNVGILFKDCALNEIIDAIAAATRGESYLCRDTAAILDNPAAEPNKPVRLTPTETEILKLIARGKTVKEMAALRCCSSFTITTHKKNLFRKLEVNSVYEATKYALRAGLYEMAEYYI